jgi:hypothetical protein
MKQVRWLALSFAVIGTSACSAGLNFSEIPSSLSFFQTEDLHGSWSGNMPSSALSPTALPTFPIEENPEFLREANHFLGPNSRFILESLKRLRPHEQILRQILVDEGLPLDVLALAMVESGFRLDARSNMGAAGPWQFMPSTARLYGLKVAKKEDQRLDPVLSTLAAARHLRDLYRLYGDWHLALAAYNAGTGSVQRAMRRAQASDFWTLARRKAFKQQTIRYVPKVLAVAAILRYVETVCTEPQEACMLHLRDRLNSGRSIVVR